MKTRSLTLLTLGLIAAILTVIGYRLARVSFPTREAALPAIRCNPSITVCSTPLPEGGRLDFSMSPNPIRPLQPLSLDVLMTGVTTDRVIIDFDGTQMSMGLNRVTLIGNGHHFSGPAMLPVCVTGSMEWSATIRITVKNKTFAIPFHFDVAVR